MVLILCAAYATLRQRHNMQAAQDFFSIALPCLLYVAVHHHFCSCLCCCLAGADEHVADSPYPLRVLPGKPCPRKCEVVGEGRSRATACQPASFSILIHDQFGNRCVQPTLHPAGVTSHVLASSAKPRPLAVGEGCMTSCIVRLRLVSADVLATRPACHSYEAPMQLATLSQALPTPHPLT